MPNIFVLTEKNDNYSYLVCYIDDSKFIPLFYDINDINRTFAYETIALTDAADIKKISVSKAELFLYCPAKPVIFTTLDRRGLNGVEYYGKKYLDHFLIKKESLVTNLNKIDSKDNINCFGG